jgi:hypothetical protein
MATTMSDTTGPRHVGRYEPLEQVGAGGMGVVYRASDPLLDRVVAVKLPLFDGPPEQRAGRVQRFQREARAIASVAHPNVCAVYDVGEQDGQPFVVMAYLPGSSLGERLKSGGRFEQIDEAVRIAQQILAALGAVHAHGIVHRDVKPGNVLFDGDGRAVLTDFGLARAEDAEALTSEGVALGTPAYMAPEQAAGQLDRVAPWTDLYAVGVVLYQMVTGRLPFEGTPLSVLPRITHEEPPRPSQLRSDIDPAVEAVILRALRKEPGERFQGAAEFAAALAGQAAERVASPALEASTTEPLPSVSVGVTREERHGAALRVVGWLAGDIFVLAPFLLLSAPPDAANAAPVWGLICIAVPALLLAVLGICIWGLVESLYVPEGLLFFAGTNMCGWARRSIARGVPCDVQNELGETPLLVAVTKGHIEMVKVLLHNGADPTIPDRFGQTALGLASARGPGDMADLLGRCAENAVPGRPGSAPVRHKHARRRLLFLAAAGAIVWITAALLKCDRVAITAEQFDRLFKSGQLKTAVLATGGKNSESYLTGAVKDPDDPNVRPLGLSGGRFWAALPRDTPREMLYTGPWKHVRVGGDPSPPADARPGIWSIVRMVAWSLLVVGLLPQPLIGLRGLYPFLALSARPLASAPLARAHKTSSGGPQR